MIGRHHGESQRRYVERVLRVEGRFATQDALYGLRYLDGTRCAITRLAAIVHDLRHEQGFVIDTTGGEGETAVYILRHCPPLPDIPRVSPRRPETPVAPVPEPAPLGGAAEPAPPARPADPVPAWVRAWRCADCGGRPAAEPVPMLGDLGRAHCATCGAPRYFRRAA